MPIEALFGVQRMAACGMQVKIKGNNNMNRKPFLVGLFVGGLLGLIPGFGLGV